MEIHLDYQAELIITHLTVPVRACAIPDVGLTHLYRIQLLLLLLVTHVRFLVSNVCCTNVLSIINLQSCKELQS